MDRNSRSSWLRSARSRGVLLLALLVLLGVGGYLLTSTTIRGDRDDAAERRARVEAVHAQEVLGRARAYVDGLAEVLAQEPEPGQARFARWAGATSESVGLNDVVWVERVRGTERRRYERLRGVPITRVTAAGRVAPAPPASYYLPATYTSANRPELRPGVDVSRFPALAAAIRDRARIFAVGASRTGALGREPGFFLLEAATFARGRGSRGYLVAFVPRGWFSTTLGDDPRRFAIHEDGRPIEGKLDSVQASASFETLGRDWRIDTSREPLSGLQSMLPWLAFAWPFAAAAIALAIGRTITRRRRLEMDVAERSAELERSEAYLAEGQRLTRAGSVAFAVPTWEVTHSSAEHSRLYGFDPDRGLPSLSDFSERIHPEDRSIPGDSLERGVRERKAVEAEFRVVVPDAGERRLLVTAQPVFDASGRIHEFVATVVDVTERRQAESELERLAGEQAALRRVATLVAREASQDEVFEAIADECAQLFGTQEFRLVRFDESPTPSEFVVASLGQCAEYLPVGSRQPLVGENMTSRVFRTGRPDRIDDYPATASGPIGEALKKAGIRSIIGAPIMVEGRLWGAMGVGSRDRVLPPGSESRLGEFTELMATAIANAESHAREERLAEEQAALRRVATLVAEDVSSSELFDAVAREVGTLLGADFSGLARFEDDAVIPVALWAAAGEHPPAPPSWARQPGDPASAIAETGQPVRWEDWGLLPGPIAAFARDDLGVQSTVGCPIFVGGRLWGALGTHWKQPESLPADTESRIAQFTDLVGTAVANAEARAEVARLAQEQAALRRVATVVAREASQAEVFAEIAEGVAQLLGAEEIRMLRYEDDRTALVVGASGEAKDVMRVGSRQPLGGENAASRVLRTRRPVRIDDYGAASGPIADAVRQARIRAAVATPILVEGRLWGTIVTATTRDEPLPPETESRLGQFTELMATAIANTESHARANRLADERAALGRVATLVAEGVEPAELFSAVTKEVARLFAGVSPLLVPSVIRFDPGPEFVLVGAAEPMSGVPMGSRWGLKDLYVSTRVFRTERSARVDESDLASLGGPDAELLRRQSFLYQVGSPIVVEGHLWGAITMNSKEALPPDTGERLEKFTELVATAIANAESRKALGELADEQTALRRVATLAAEGAPPGAVFDAVAAEMEAVLDADQVALNRFEPGDKIVVLAHRGRDVDRTPVGSHVRIDGESATAEVRRTGRPARMENYESAEGAIAELARATGLRSSVSAPITVEGGAWGVITASWKGDRSPPPDTEERMAKFAALLDTAIANAEARTEVERLADEQAALRRVATLVAHEAPAAEVFAAVAAEVGRLLGIEDTTIFRYEGDSTATVVADRGERAVPMPIGSRVSLEGESATALVHRTGRSARVDDFSGATGPLADYTRNAGIGSTVGSPIVVDGRLWGAMIAATRTDEPMPADSESRMAQFTELVATAISNMQARSDLAASRARIVEAADEERRRVVRDLHDGAQQRLVHTIVTLKLAKRAFLGGDGNAESLVGEALQHAEQGNAELRELAHGILPAVLTHGGLRAAFDTFVARLDLPVRVDVPDERFPADIEASAYFVVAEALTNVVKHSQAGSAEVAASVDDGTLHLEIRDDGIGGADANGNGLVGMDDRVTALGGRLNIESPPGGGTRVAATVPLRAE
jgi:GAF domain-containing protein/PAS domain-containing protein